MSIVGVLGQATAGVSIVNSVLVELQTVPFDIKTYDNIAFLFTYRDEDSIDLRSDITDHFTEDNTALQDQIALKPAEITVHGFVGELTDLSDTGIVRAIQDAATKLGVLAVYVPDLTAQVLQVYNQTKQLYDAANNAATVLTQLWDLGVGADNQNKQQKAYALIEKYWKLRRLFTVKTPWKVFNNMAILSVRATQDAETQTVSDFKITFKEMRFASTVGSVLTIADGRLASQKQALTSMGYQNPTEIGPLDPTSLSQPKAFA